MEMCIRVTSLPTIGSDERQPMFSLFLESAPTHYYLPDERFTAIDKIRGRKFRLEGADGMTKATGVLGFYHSAHGETPTVEWNTKEDNKRFAPPPGMGGSFYAPLFVEGDRIVIGLTADEATLKKLWREMVVG